MRQIAFLIFAVFQFPAFGLEAEKLSLEDIKRYAVGHNFGLKAAAAAADEAQAVTVQKRSAFFPKLSVVAGPDVRSEPKRNTSETLAHFEGKWNLFRGSSDKLEFEISELNSQIASSAKRRAQFELELDVESLFYLHLINTAKLNGYRAASELNDKHRQLIRRRQQSGMASQADVMEFELRDSYLKSEMSSLTQVRDEARMGLSRLMGPNISSFEPVGRLPHTHLKLPVQVFLSKINSTSEPVKQASLASAAGAVAHKQSHANWFPSIDAEARYGKLSQDIASGNPAFQGLLLMKWEFFSGFETNGKIAEARARATRLENEFRQKLLSTMSDAEISYSRLLSIQERVHVEESNEARAEKYYAAVLDEYRRGIKNGADLKVAEDSLLQARIRASDFRYKFLEDKLRLERAIGFLIETIPHGALDN